MIIVNGSEVSELIAEAAGFVFNPGVDHCIAREESGILMGGVVFEAYTGSSIAMHVAGLRDNWLNRDLLWAAFHYPFVQLEVIKIFLQIPETNTKSLEFALNLGFSIIVKLEDVFPDGACIVLSMAKKDCRWLGIRPKGIKSNTPPSQMEQVNG